MNQVVEATLKIVGTYFDLINSNTRKLKNW